jgi:hypothetical protein
MPLVQRSKRPPPSAAAPTYEIDADASAAPPPEPQKDGAGTWLFGSLEGVGSAMATSPDNVLAGGARVGLGLAVPRWYAHLQVGLLVGSAREERTSTELVLSAGHAFGDSLHLGLAGGLRFASSELAKPWLDEAWFLGIGCAQRVIHFDGGAVWLDELFAPLGFRKRRAGFVGDTVVAGDRNDYAPRVDVGIVLQLDLLDLR